MKFHGNSLFSPTVCFYNTITKLKYIWLKLFSRKQFCLGETYFNFGMTTVDAASTESSEVKWPAVLTIQNRI